VRRIAKCLGETTEEEGKEARRERGQRKGRVLPIYNITAVMKWLSKEERDGTKTKERKRKEEYDNIWREI